MLNPHDVSFVAIVNRKSDLAQTYQFVFTATLTPDMMNKLVLQSSELDEFALVSKADIKKAERVYGRVIEQWAAGEQGYIEQRFDLQANG